MAQTLVALMGVFLVVSLFIHGRRRPGYSHRIHTISELAEAGSPLEKPVSYGVFLPIGVAMAALACWLQGNEAALLFTASLAVGYGCAAIFPIDPDAPALGTWRNGLHNLSAGASYVLAMGGFETLARDQGSPYDLGKFLIFGFILSIYVPGLRDWRGLLQRVTEVAIFAGTFASVS